jgi:hypothetical protein
MKKNWKLNFQNRGRDVSFPTFEHLKVILSSLSFELVKPFKTSRKLSFLGVMSFCMLNYLELLSFDQPKQIDVEVLVSAVH